MENLLTYSFVNAGLLALRFRETVEKRNENEWYAWAYLVLTLFFSISWGYQWPWPITIILGMAVIAMIVKMHYIPQPSMIN